jgi:hypothetical protein
MVIVLTRLLLLVGFEDVLEGFEVGMGESFGVLEADSDLRVRVGIEEDEESRRTSAACLSPVPSFVGPRETSTWFWMCSGGMLRRSTGPVPSW